MGAANFSKEMSGILFVGCALASFFTIQNLFFGLVVVLSVENLLFRASCRLDVQFRLVGISRILRISFSLENFLDEIKSQLLQCFCRNMRNSEIELDNVDTGIPECWWNDFGLKECCDRFTVCEYCHRFRGSPKYLSKIFECKEYRQELLGVLGHLQLGSTRGLGSISNWCVGFPCRAAEKLASVMRAFCLTGRGCLSASSQHCSNRSGVLGLFRLLSTF